MTGRRLCVSAKASHTAKLKVPCKDLGGKACSEQKINFQLLMTYYYISKLAALCAIGALEILLIVKQTLPLCRQR